MYSCFLQFTLTTWRGITPNCFGLSTYLMENFARYKPQIPKSLVFELLHVAMFRTSLIIRTINRAGWIPSISTLTYFPHLHKYTCICIQKFYLLRSPLNTVSTTNKGKHFQKICDPLEEMFQSHHCLNAQPLFLNSDLLVLYFPMKGNVCSKPILPRHPRILWGQRTADVG